MLLKPAWALAGECRGIFFCKVKKSSYLCSPVFGNLSPERCSSGLRGTPGKRVYSKRVSRVRISVSPQKKQPIKAAFFVERHAAQSIFLTTPLLLFLCRHPRPWPFVSHGLRPGIRRDTVFAECGLGRFLYGVFLMGYMCFPGCSWESPL